MIEKLVFLLMLTLPNNGLSFLMDSSDDPPAIISRSEWGAKASNGSLSALKVNPPTYVVIHHAASAPCTTRAICQARVRAFQDYHMQTKHWQDIGYNFLVGEDGNIYEGRGWGKTGAHLVNYNSKSIGICFIGNFEKIVPNKAATEAAKNLISYGVSQNKISGDYSLIAHRQAWKTLCPGDKLYELVKTWPQWIENP